MNWTTVCGFHFNLNQLQSFIWLNGALILVFSGRTGVERILDPDKVLYHKLCNQVSLLPEEVDASRVKD